MPSPSRVAAMSGAVSISLASEVSPPPKSSTALWDFSVMMKLRNSRSQRAVWAPSLLARWLLDLLEPGGERAIGGIEGGQDGLAALLGHTPDQPAHLDRLAAVAAA